MSYEIILSVKICPICMTECHDYLSLPCSHDFCKPCLQKYFSIKILEHDVRSMQCPDCFQDLPLALLQLILGSQQFEKYKKIKSEKELERNEFVKWCPKAGCNGYDVASKSNKNLICNVCGSKFCFICSKPWHKEKCKFLEDPVFKKWAKSEDIKICPRCKSYVLKDGGCPHMTCTRCSFKWCWICGKEFSIATHNYFRCLVTKNGFEFYWYIIFLCVFFPLVLPFWLFVLIVYKIEIADDFFIESKKIKKYKIIIYPLCLVLSPLGLLAGALVPFVLFGSLFHKLTKKTKVKANSPLIVLVYLIVFFISLAFVGLIIAGFIFILAVGCVILPPVGCVLLIIKIGFCMYKCIF